MRSREQTVSRRLAVYLTILLSVAMCAAAGAEPQAVPEEQGPAALDCGPPAGLALAWKPIFQGVEYGKAVKTDPPVVAHAVRIRLQTPGIAFLATPSNGDKPGETDGRKVSAFLKEHGLQVAINASPYGPVNNIDGGLRDIAGLSISQGEICSQPGPSYAALLIGRENKVWFDTPPIDTTGAYNAVGGFHMLLADGTNVGTGGERHPRTAVGTSRDGACLYFLVIDGRQPRHSLGTTTAETAEWLRALGAYTALNLDGGGSTALAIDDGHGGAKVMNRPIHAFLPGRERVNGNNLGVHARPLKQAGLMKNEGQGAGDD